MYSQRGCVSKPAQAKNQRLLMAVKVPVKANTQKMMAKSTLDVNPHRFLSRSTHAGVAISVAC